VADVAFVGWSGKGSSCGSAESVGWRRGWAGWLPLLWYRGVLALLRNFIDGDFVGVVGNLVGRSRVGGNAGLFAGGGVRVVFFIGVAVLGAFVLGECSVRVGVGSCLFLATFTSYPTRVVAVEVVLGVGERLVNFVEHGSGREGRRRGLKESLLARALSAAMCFDCGDSLGGDGGESVYFCVLRNDAREQGTPSFWRFPRQRRHRRSQPSAKGERGWPQSAERHANRYRAFPKGGPQGRRIYA
jgi:hypothetical protein